MRWTGTVQRFGEPCHWAREEKSKSRVASKDLMRWVLKAKPDLEQFRDFVDWNVSDSRGVL